MTEAKGTNHMRVSRSQMLFTVCREAVVLFAYQDGKHPSIGMGSNSPDLKLGDTITVREAFERFKVDVASRETDVNRAVKVPLTQNQFDAVWDLYYQNGNKPDGQGRPGFKTMVSLLNAGKFDEAAEYLLECHYNSKGVSVDGLKNRRALEREVFLHGNYGDLNKVKLFRTTLTKYEWYTVQPEDLD